MTGITLRGIRKSYRGGPEVLHGVDLDIAPGEFVVIVGPSGCGKSTLLRLIAGLDPCDQGDVEIGGRRVNDVAPQDRDIAMIFQNYALYPHMTVRENIAFGLELRRVPKRVRVARAEEVARMLRLDPFLDRKPGQLSGGQRQRVAMGRAIARDCPIFLMDEPLSNLDNALRTEMRTEIRDLHRQLGATIVYVTHDQTEALSMSDRVAVMLDGNLQQFDTPAAIFDRPANRFVAGFLGTPAMNFLPGPALAETDGVELGFRPEAVTVSDAQPESGALAGRIVHGEMTGTGSVLHVETDHGRIRVLSPRREAMAGGAPVWLGFDMAQAHRFDAAAGRRIV